MYFLRILFRIFLSILITDVAQSLACDVIGQSSKLRSRSRAITAIEHGKKPTFQKEARDGSSSLVFRRSPVLSDAQRALVLEFGGRQLQKEQVAVRLPHGLKMVKEPSWDPDIKKMLSKTATAEKVLPTGLEKAYQKAYLDSAEVAGRAYQAHMDAQRAQMLKSPFHDAEAYAQAAAGTTKAQWALTKAANACERCHKTYRDAFPYRPVYEPARWVSTLHFMQHFAPSSPASPREREAWAKRAKIAKAVLNVASVNKDMQRRMARVGWPPRTAHVFMDDDLRVFLAEMRKADAGTRNKKQKTATARKKATERRRNTPYE